VRREAQMRDDEGRPLRPGKSTVTLPPRNRIGWFVLIVASTGIAAYAFMRMGTFGRTVAYVALVAGMIGVMRILINLGVALPGACWLRLGPEALSVRAWWRTRSWPWAEIEAVEPPLRGFFVRTARLRLRSGRGEACRALRSSARSRPRTSPRCRRRRR